MPFRLYGLTWLAYQSSARWLRTDWPNTKVLAQELWTVMSRLRDQEQVPINVTNLEETIEQIQQRIEDIDVVFPQPPTVPPTTVDPNPDNPTIVTQTRSFWERNVVPCKVGTKVEDNTYNVTLYPYGDMTPLAANDPPTVTATGDVEGSEFTVSTTALQLQLHEDEIIPADTWTLAVLIQQWSARETYTDGILTSQTLTLLQQNTFMQIPVWL